MCKTICLTFYLLFVLVIGMVVVGIKLYTVMAKNIGTLGKYDQRSLWKWICIVNPFDLLF